MPPTHGYGNFYAPFIPRARHNQWVQHCASAQDAARAAQVLGARHVFGYAAGGAPYIRVAYSDRGTHEELVQLLPAGRALHLKVGEPWALPEDAGEAPSPP